MYCRQIYNNNLELQYSLFLTYPEDIINKVSTWFIRVNIPELIYFVYETSDCDIFSYYSGLDGKYINTYSTILKPEEINGMSFDTIKPVSIKPPLKIIYNKHDIKNYYVKKILNYLPDYPINLSIKELKELFTATQLITAIFKSDYLINLFIHTENLLYINESILLDLNFEI